MTIFAHTTTRYALWALVIFSLHISGMFTVFALFISSILLVWTNYFFEKTGREKEFGNRLVDWLWLPILVGTVLFVLVEYVF